MGSQMDKSLQKFYNSFTEILQERRILIANYCLHIGRKIRQRQTPSNRGASRIFGTPTEKSGQNYGSY